MSSGSRNALTFVGNAYERERQYQKTQPATIMWDKTELNLLLGLYGRRVAAGAWRDYAIDGRKDMAVFSVFKRSQDTPLYRIEKHPALRRRQGMYALVNSHGLILKRGRELDRLLRYFDQKQGPRLYWRTGSG
ncbi:MAG: DUF2794 domain-containing protein [Parvibaculales bacterium]